MSNTIYSSNDNPTIFDTSGNVFSGNSTLNKSTVVAAKNSSSTKSVPSSPGKNESFNVSSDLFSYLGSIEPESLGSVYQNIYESLDGYCSIIYLGSGAKTLFQKNLFLATSNLALARIKECYVATEAFFKLSSQGGDAVLSQENDELLAQRNADQEILLVKTDIKYQDRDLAFASQETSPIRIITKNTNVPNDDKVYYAVGLPNSQGQILVQGASYDNKNIHELLNVRQSITPAWRVSIWNPVTAKYDTEKVSATRSIGVDNSTKRSKVVFATR